MPHEYSSDSALRLKIKNQMSSLRDFIWLSSQTNFLRRRHPKIKLYFDDRCNNLDSCFHGDKFKDEDTLWQLMSDIGFGLDIVKRNDPHSSLIPNLQELVGELKKVLEMDYDAVF